jgi:hypothetical protein
MDENLTEYDKSITPRCAVKGSHGEAPDEDNAERVDEGQERGVTGGRNREE